MAFIPESDFSWRGKKSCGVDGSAAVAEARASLRRTALHQPDPKPMPLYLTRPDRHVSDTNARIMTDSRSWLGRIGEKPTHDFPGGGKHVGTQGRSFTPSPIITPEYMASITGSVRRLGPVDVPQDRLRRIWSEGREAAKRDYAGRVAATPSPIPFQNPSRLVPIDKVAPQYANRGPVPQTNIVAGFTGMGNRMELPAKPTKPQRGNVLPLGQLAFMGERKPPMATIDRLPPQAA